MDNDVVSITIAAILDIARSSRNNALDQLETANATIDQLKRERAELRQELDVLRSSNAPE